MRRTTSLASVLFAIIALSPGAAAQDEGALSDGGHVEVPEAGFAVSMPDGWVTIRPTGSTVDVILDEVQTVVPRLAPTIEAALASGLGFSLLSLAPDSDPAFTENCNVLVRAATGQSIDEIGADEMSKLAPLGDALAGEPTLSFEELPAGRAARMELALRLPTFDTASTSWIFTDGANVHTLTCTDLARPEDGWRSIAETFEFLEMPA